jgi:hypothetical protein
VGVRGQIESQAAYEYYRKVDPSGNHWTYRMVSTSGGSTNDTLYEESTGLPASITVDGLTTTFKYGEGGKVVEKDTPETVTRLSYDYSSGKVNYVEKCSKSNPNSCNRSHFKYDAHGNLKTAEADASVHVPRQHVSLSYDRKGRIATLQGSGRLIELKYGPYSKPVRIKVSGIGAIEVDYDDSGQIVSTRVMGSDGKAAREQRRISVQVLTAMKELQEILQPAGVSLTFL